MILGGLAAVGIGFWFGLPGRFEQTTDEIEQLMDRGGSRRRRQVKRTFTPLDLWHRRERASSRRREEARRRFSTATPDAETDPTPGTDGD